MEISNSILKPLGDEFAMVGELEDLVYNINEENIPKIGELIKKMKNFEYSYIFHIIIHVASFRPLEWRTLADLWATLEKPHKKFVNTPFTEYLVVRGILQESDLCLVLANKRRTPSEMERIFRRGSLEEAVLHDDVEKLKQMTIGKRIDVISFLIKNKTHTIASFAAYYGAVNCFKYLIEIKCPFEEETPQYAAYGGNLEILSLCRDQGYSLSGCLRCAVQSNRKELVNWLLKNIGYEPVELSKCLKACNTPAFVFFLSKNANYSMSKVTKKSSLIVATEIGNFAAVKYLVEKCGANIDASDENGWNAFSYAADYQYGVISNYLLDHGADIEKCGNDDWTPLLWSASAGNHIATKFLLDRGANIEAKNADGNTSLMVALKSGHVNVAEILIEKQAQLEVVDMDGLTILITTAMNGLLEGVKLLVENGANIEANINGLTAFYFAVLRGQFQVAKYLIEKGANIEPVEENGITPLIFCSAYGLPASVKMLIDCNANIEAKDINGLTSLMWASRNNKENIISMLIDAGANVNEKNNDGDTALLIAVRRKNTKAVKKLMENGADSAIANNKGWTALAAANEIDNDIILSLVSNETVIIETPDAPFGIITRKAQSENTYENIQDNEIQMLTVRYDTAPITPQSQSVCCLII
jgi:ankyrin repeat protein